ncbi:DUF5667 domain-containing protein [Labedaea rhizosphaerae]|uniref:DUF5667 domain-containing protein n=1 Tax=Labedaea rhizosphaerae TaxID=598644 RepID=A0A4R6SNH6_LABRH|nr:DUF5667 domain-containing protein [Labedaea rhizosphaerae]TDQ05597.1 hypothetical protein EV186_1011571 [Labedaea rhizosphaerae]
MNRRRTPSGRGDQHEHSARAAGPHPGDGAGTDADLIGFSTDERSLVAMLSDLAEATAPDHTERARMRSRVLAGLAEDGKVSPSTTPRLVRPPSGRSGRRPGARRRPPRGPRNEDDKPRATSARGRFAIAAVAVLCLVFALGGMSLLLSRDALPGDALYGIKRSAEAASLGLTFGDEQKAFKHLEFATARVSEMETLAQRYGPGDAPVGGYLSALTDFDTDASAGSRQLIAMTTRQDGSLLSTLSSWGRQQASRLTAITDRLPTAARSRAASSLALATAIADRADALSQRLPCDQITSGNADAIGALPATTTCVRSGGQNPSEPGSGPNRNPSVNPSVTTTPTPGPGGAAPGRPVPTESQPQPGLPGAPILTMPSPGTETSGGTTPPTTTTTSPALVIPLPLPPISLGPLLPGLPGIQLGG